MSKTYSTQNDLLLKNLFDFYMIDSDASVCNDVKHIQMMLNIINGESRISLRIVDWFATNYAKKNYTLYNIENKTTNSIRRFKVYDDYKLKLKAYSKRRFDPFCRWDRIAIPFKDNQCIQTTIGQLNFFKWAIENKVIDYIEKHFDNIEKDMNSRNSTSRKRDQVTENKTRKKREELSILASKSIKKENVEIIVKFS